MSYRAPTPTHAGRQILAAVGVSIALIVAGTVALKGAAGEHEPTQRTVPSVTVGEAPHSRVVIHGCKAEDSCSIDYRNGRWHIQRGRF